MVLASEDKVKEPNLKPIAQIVAQAHFAQNHKWFTTPCWRNKKPFSNKLG